MKNERRNDKRHQQERLLAYREADQTMQDLHRLLAKPGRDGLSVGQMVNVAAKMGLLQPARARRARERSSLEPQKMGV